MNDPLLNHILQELQDAQADDVVQIDIQGLSDMADTLVIATGRSSPHLKSIVKRIKENIDHDAPVPIDGIDSNEWIIIDFGHIMVHVMKGETRDFYRLESLWGQPNNESTSD